MKRFFRQNFAVVLSLALVFSGAFSLSANANDVMETSTTGHCGSSNYIIDKVIAEDVDCRYLN